MGGKQSIRFYGEDSFEGDAQDEVVLDDVQYEVIGSVEGGAGSASA